MKNLWLILLTSALMINTSCAVASPMPVAGGSAQINGIEWLYGYDEALKIAESKDLPILLFFTGSDWCTWCTKLEKEALHTPEFAEIAGGKFVFVHLDFPMHRSQEPRLASQNQSLKKKYGVSGFPSVIVTDSKGNRIGQTGYRKGGGVSFADHLLNMVNSYQKHRHNMQDLGSNQNVSQDDLKAFYLKARELGDKSEAQAILEKGLKTENNQFFQLEQYRVVIENGDMHAKEAIRIRDKLLAVSSDKAAKVNHDVAIIEFQVLQQKMKRDKLSPTAVVSPLMLYLDKYGAQNPEAWRVDMAIAQVYVEAGQPQEALRYAQQAQQMAPSKFKTEIDNATQYIRSQIKS